MPHSSNPVPEGYRIIRVSESDEDQREEHISVVIRSAVQEAVTEAVEKYMPAEAERKWVQLAMKREARREQLHNAIIEKSLTALVWAGIAGLGIILLEWLKLHGWKSTP